MGVRRNPKRRSKESVSEEKNISIWARTWINEVLAVIFTALAVFNAVGLFSHFALDHISANTNLMGPVGHLIATLLTGFLGASSVAVVLLLFSFSFYLWRLDYQPAAKPRLSSIIGFLVVLISTSSLFACFWGSNGGGLIGNSIVNFLQRLFSLPGTILILVAIGIIGASQMLKVGTLSLVTKLWSLMFNALSWLLQGPLFCVRGLKIAVPYLWKGLVHLIFGTPDPEAIELREALKSEKKAAERIVQDKKLKNKEREEEIKVAADNRLSNRVEKSITTSNPKEESDPEPIPEDARVVVSRRALDLKTKRREFVRVLDETPKKLEEEKPNPFAGYQLPALSLLTPAETSVGTEDDKELLATSTLIENKLKDFGIAGKVTEVHPGPVITLYEFEPAPGVKVGRIAALSDDLAMGLRASSIRIVAPIPKKGTVGIEVPNRNRDLVRLRDVLESDGFVNSDSILSISVGKDTYGDPVVLDLAAMPHLLIAGATGTGKSVCINTVLLSLLYRASPAELGLIMIDPKILELSVYEGIPHLRVPVVTQPRGAKAVLQWAVDEMHRRYRYIQKFGVRNIDGYNKLVSGEDVEGIKSHNNANPQFKFQQSPAVELEESEIVEEGTVDKLNLGEVNRNVDDGLFQEELKPLPKIVIVIDEVADLMLSVGREIEELITRLAQKARAAGIHLIIATQRPSVDVITGLIKANFPARLSFRVTSRVDSRTILDSMGAEKLLGKGDMLFMLPGAEGLKRVHGAFVSDNEVKKVVKVVKDQAGPQYDQHIMHAVNKAVEEAKREEGEGSEEDTLTGTASTEYDSMYDKAVELVVQKGYASTSMVQRVFRIGYNRAARIIELMEKEGIVGPMDGAKPREVLVPNRIAENSDI